MNRFTALIVLTFGLGNVNNRFLAVKFLGMYGGFRAQELLIKTAVGDQDVRIRQVALESARLRFGSVATEAFIEKLITSREALELEGLDLLVQLGEEAIPSLVKFSISNNSASSKRAMQVLGRIGSS